MIHEADTARNMSDISCCINKYCLSRYLQDTEVTGSVIIGPEVANLPSHWKQETFKL